MSGWEVAGWIVVSIVGLTLVVDVVTVITEQFAEWRRRTAKFDALRQVIHTDSQMFANCLRLAVEHFRALSRLRDGGPR